MRSHLPVTITHKGQLFCLLQEAASYQRKPVQLQGLVEEHSGMDGQVAATSGEAAVGGLSWEPHRTFNMALRKIIFDSNLSRTDK